jgi:hypothetical protein
LFFRQHLVGFFDGREVTLIVGFFLATASRTGCRHEYGENKNNRQNNILQSEKNYFIKDTKKAWLQKKIPVILAAGFYKIHL